MMDQVKFKKDRAKLIKTKENDYIFLDESPFSPLYYARFKTRRHAWLAWGFWHSTMIY